MKGGRNIVLIGMPGVGKSTMGVILAKVLSRDFIDTDVYIQTREGRSLQKIIDAEGLAIFCDIEERYVMTLKCKNSVIATGGSVVYSRKAMEHLRSSGIIIYLFLPVKLLKERIETFSGRGLVIRSNQDIDGLYTERLPLYDRYKDIEIDCSYKTHEEVISLIILRLKEYLKG